VLQERSHPRAGGLAAQLGQRPYRGCKLLRGELWQLLLGEIDELGQNAWLVHTQLGQSVQGVGDGLGVVLAQVAPC
jgi:hypothetical protein